MKDNYFSRAAVVIVADAVAITNNAKLCTIDIITHGIYLNLFSLKKQKI